MDKLRVPETTSLNKELIQIDETFAFFYSSLICCSLSHNVLPLSGCDLLFRFFFLPLSFVPLGDEL
jgi:hypothetical protein